MPSVALVGSGSRSKTGWKAATQGSLNILCFVPERAKIMFSFSTAVHNLTNTDFTLIKEQTELSLNWASPSSWSWWSSEPDLWRRAPEQIVAGCSASDGLLWAATEASWNQTRFLKAEILLIFYRTLWGTVKKEGKVWCSGPHLSLTFLCLFFLTAAIIEVKMVCGNL